MLIAPSCSAAEATKKTKQNRLAAESSPYLRMHAHNPVDWYAWGTEALDRARRENKVIFLSVGYSSCYWCHVMERESFMDDEIARFLNEHFVCVKVDREERPDIDSIYMTAVQIMTRRGGWPMSVFLTPDAKPFFGGTYFPARDGDRNGATGFLTVIRKIDELWNAKTDEIKNNADQLTEYVRTELRGRPEREDEPRLDSKTLDQVQASLAEVFDNQYGGFGYDASNPRQPKFPEPSNLYFLLDRARRDGDADAKKMLAFTLERMQMGGIWDHVGGGFHRYSTDRFWRIPHFEKMLYDNGQLATVYTEAYLLTKREDFRRTADELIQFVLQEMRDEQGGFYSAIDAESEQVEGKYYRWERNEVQTLLGADFPTFAAVYGLDGPPNFEEFYVPLLSKPWEEIAAGTGQKEEALWDQLRPLRKKLFDARSKRARPLTDTKILVSWNGLMIRGLADAGRGLGKPQYVQAAAQAADFVLAKLRRPDGRLFRTYTAGEPKLNAYLDDYAFLADGLIALHRATDETKWLEAADELTQLQIKYFWDEQDGGFFFTSGDHETLMREANNQPTERSLPATR